MPEQFQPIQVKDRGKGPEFEVSFDKSRLGTVGKETEMVNLEFYFESKKKEIEDMLKDFYKKADKEHRPWYWFKNHEKFKKALDAYAQKVNGLLESFVDRIREIHKKNPDLINTMLRTNPERIQDVVSLMGPDFKNLVLLSMNQGIENIIRNPGNMVAGSSGSEDLGRGVEVANRQRNPGMGGSQLADIQNELKR